MITNAVGPPWINGIMMLIQHSHNLEKDSRPVSCTVYKKLTNENNVNFAKIEISTNICILITCKK